MDVKSDFLNKYIQEELYVDSPLVFINLTFLNHDFKLKKYLYSLKQAPKAWYSRLRKFLLQNNFKEDKLIKLFLSRKSSMTF